jgi:dolichol-phosphate mannosyltransferase
MDTGVHISVITPIYGCVDSIKQLYKRVVSTLSTVTEEFEIIMINDASPDNAWDVIKELSREDNRVKGINLSRNFGQHRAITAGLDYAQGDWTVVMDCDLQDQPEEIIKLYNKAQEGYHVVIGKRAKRQDIFLKKLSSKIFFTLYNYLTDIKVNSNIGNFGIYSRSVIDTVKQFQEQNRSFGLFVVWSGFSRVEIDIHHAKREIGKSSYTLRKLINLAIDSIVSQSNKPLKLSIKFGFLISFFSLMYAVWLVGRYFISDIHVEGWTSVMVSIYFIAGLIFMNLGFLGLYIGKIFDEVKNRPLYIIQDTTFKENNHDK